MTTSAKIKATKLDRWGSPSPFGKKPTSPKLDRWGNPSRWGN